MTSDGLCAHHGRDEAHHIFPLHSASIDNLEQLIKAGIMVTHGTSV
jgi:hypothetical protein